MRTLYQLKKDVALEFGIPFEEVDKLIRLAYNDTDSLYVDITPFVLKHEKETLDKFPLLSHYATSTGGLREEVRRQLKDSPLA